MVDQRPAEAEDRQTPGNGEGDLTVGAFNRSAIGTLVERATRSTILVHLDGAARAERLRDQLTAVFGCVPAHLRRSLTWDQGGGMCHHHTISSSVGTPVFFCNPGHPWQRPSNENTNGLRRNSFPKGSDLRVRTPAELLRVGDELNRRPRKTLGWQTAHDLFTTLQTEAV